MTVQDCPCHGADLHWGHGATGPGGTMLQDTMGWRVTAEQLNQTWGLGIPPQYFLVFSAL